jgi:hypothetical protein
MSTADCKETKTCSLSGMLIVNGDKGFIGELQVEENKCVNVSLPEETSLKLIDKKPIKITLKGIVMPYPDYDDASELIVNGRKVGFGWCDDFYVFVKDGDFQIY